MAPFDDAHGTHDGTGGAPTTDIAPTANSTNFLTSGAVHAALATKEEALTFANSISASGSGSVSRSEGSNTVVFTPPDLGSLAPLTNPVFAGNISNANVVITTHVASLPASGTAILELNATNQGQRVALASQTDHIQYTYTHTALFADKQEHIPLGAFSAGE